MSNLLRKKIGRLRIVKLRQIPAPCVPLGPQVRKSFFFFSLWENKQEERKDLISFQECTFPFPPQVAQFGPSVTRRYKDRFPIMVQALALAVMSWENWLQPHGDWRRWIEHQGLGESTSMRWCRACRREPVRWIKVAVWQHRWRARPGADLLPCPVGGSDEG